MSDHIPQEGDAFSPRDLDMILEAVRQRQENFKEPTSLSMLLVFLNIGDRFSEVECLEQEWKGLKKDIPRPENDGDVPKCPNGHTLTQGPPLKLVWARES